MATKQNAPLDQRWMAARKNDEGGFDIIDETNKVVGHITDENDARAFVKRWNAHPALHDAVEHVLIASEDNGDMEDISFDTLRKALEEAV